MVPDQNTARSTSQKQEVVRTEICPGGQDHEDRKHLGMNDIAIIGGGAACLRSHVEILTAESSTDFSSAFGNTIKPQLVETLEPLDIEAGTCRGDQNNCPKP